MVETKVEDPGIDIILVVKNSIGIIQVNVFDLKVLVDLLGFEVVQIVVDVSLQVTNRVDSIFLKTVIDGMN